MLLKDTQPWTDTHFWSSCFRSAASASRLPLSMTCRKSRWASASLCSAGLTIDLSQPFPSAGKAPRQQMCSEGAAREEVLLTDMARKYFCRRLGSVLWVSAEEHGPAVLAPESMPSQ